MATAQDTAFDQQVVWSADHDQVFDIVAAHEHQPAPGIDVACFKHAETFATLAASGRDELRAGLQTAHDPCEQKDKQDDGNKRQGELSYASAILPENRIEPIPHSKLSR
jgi:hypothetical protein